MIYDHNNKSGNNKVIVAKEALCIFLKMNNISSFLRRKVQLLRNRCIN